MWWFRLDFSKVILSCLNLIDFRHQMEEEEHMPSTEDSIQYLLEDMKIMNELDLEGMIC